MSDTTNPEASGESQMAEVDAAIETAQSREALSDSSSDMSAAEAEARVQGWRPKSEFNGDQPWIDAKTFLARGERFRSKQAETIEALKAEAATFRGTAAQMRKFMDAQLAKRDEEHKLDMQELRLQIKAATREGDDGQALKLEDEMAARQTAHAATQVELSAQPAPVNSAAMEIYNDWIADGNDWINGDKILGDHAFAVGKHLKANGNTLTGKAFLDFVKAKVEDDFPRRFAEANAKQQLRTPTTAGGGKPNAGQNSGESYNGKTVNDLPAEDLQIMKNLIKSGFCKNPAEYLKLYYS